MAMATSSRENELQADAVLRRILAGWSLPAAVGKSDAEQRTEIVHEISRLIRFGAAFPLEFTDPARFFLLEKARITLISRGWRKALQAETVFQQRIVNMSNSDGEDDRIEGVGKHGLTWEEWEERFTRIGERLAERGLHSQLTVIGSLPIMRRGMPGRTSLDADVWRDGSRFDPVAMRAACEAEGVAYNPVDDFVDRPYIQIVDGGIVQMPKLDDLKIEGSDSFGGSLEMHYPTPEILIASKLAAGRGKDIEDCVFLATKCQLEMSGIEAAIETLPSERAREAARENLVIIEVTLVSEEHEQTRSRSLKP